MLIISLLLCRIAVSRNNIIEDIKSCLPSIVKDNFLLSALLSFLKDIALSIKKHLLSIHQIKILLTVSYYIVINQPVNEVKRVS